MNRQAAPLARLVPVAIGVLAALGLLAAGTSSALALSTSSISTAIHNAQHATVTTIAAGTTVHDSVSVSGLSGRPTGMVTVSAFTNGTCTGTAVGSWTATLGASPINLNLAIADVTASAETPMTPGTELSYRATYAGNSTYGPLTAACEVLTVHKATPTITASLQFASGQAASTALVGTSVFLHVAVSGSIGTPTGEVTLARYDNGTCTAPAAVIPTQSLIAGSLVSPAYSLPAGSYSYRAVYGGDGKYGNAVGPCLPMTWTKAGTSTTILLQGSNHITDQPLVGDPMLATVNVTGSAGTPSGHVRIDKFTAADCTGTPVSTEYLVTAGTLGPIGVDVRSAPVVQSWRVSYLGDDAHLTSTSTCHIVRWKANVTSITGTFVSASGGTLSQEIFGIEGHMNASVRGSFGLPQGSVRTRFYPNGACTSFVLSDTEPLVSGDAVPATAALSFEPGSWSYRIDYLAPADLSGNYLGIIDTCVPFTISKAGVQLVVGELDANGSPTDAKVGRTTHPTIRTFSVGGTVTGTVDVSMFSASIGGCGGTPVATAVGLALVNGRVDVPAMAVTPTSAGALSYLVTYAETAHFNHQSGCFVLPVLAADATPIPPTPSPAPTATEPASSAGASPAPGSSPGPTLQPGASPGPGSSSAPVASDASEASGGPSGPGSSLAPGQSLAPSQSVAPVAAGSTAGAVPTDALGNPLPTQPGGGIGAVVSPLGASGEGGLDVVVAALLVVALGGVGLGAWLARRRRLPGP